MIANIRRTSGRQPRLGLFVLCAFLLVENESAQPSVVYMSVNFPGTGRLVRFEGETRILSESFGIGSQFSGITSSSDGGMLISDSGANLIRRVSPTGTALSPFASIDSPVFLEADSRGNVYTTHVSSTPTTAFRFDSAGNITQTYTISDTWSLGGVDADALGNAYVCDRTRQRLFKFAPDGTLLNITSIPFYTSDIAVDEAGKRLFLGVQQDFGIRDRAGVWIFDITGDAPQYVRNIIAPTGSEITGVHYSPETGHIFIVDIGWNTHESRGLEYSDNGELLQQYMMPSGYQGADLVWLPVPEPSVTCLLMAWAVVIPRRLWRDKSFSLPRYWSLQQT